MESYSNNAHYSYFETTRHWAPESEKYAGGDALITALRRNWKVAGPVYQEDFWHSGARLVTVYHFTLRCQDGEMDMPVITNPYVRRVLQMIEAQVLPIEERESIRRREQKRD
jgi:hypothetical protein